MNMQIRPQVTGAEKALADAFNHQMEVAVESAAVSKARRDLFSEIVRSGLPTRRNEAWHYTDLKRLLTTIPTVAEGAPASLPPLVEGSSSFAIFGDRTFEIGITNQMESEPLQTELRDGSATGSFFAIGADDFIGKVNGSFAGSGQTIWIEENTRLSAPIELQHQHGGGSFHARTRVEVGRGAHATILERHASVSEKAAFVTTISELRVQDAADVVWIVLQQQGDHDTHLGQLRVDLGKNAKLTIYVVNAGGRLVRQELRVSVSGQGADLQVRGINLLAGDAHCDTTLMLDHAVPNTTSIEINRSVVFDRAHGVFQGMVRVAPDAQKTNAKMSCNTLLLSDDAQFSAKPELEIFADDVQCGHGATVSDIDTNHLYYLMARGIPERKARALLVHGFVAEMLDDLKGEEIGERLSEVVEIWLSHHA